MPRSAAGDPGSCDLREVLNALLYQKRTARQRRLLPHHLPNRPGSVEISGCSCDLGFCGCEVVGGLEFGRWDVAYPTVEAPVAVPVGPPGCGELDLGEGLPGPVARRRASRSAVGHRLVHSWSSRPQPGPEASSDRDRASRPSGDGSPVASTRAPHAANPAHAASTFLPSTPAGTSELWTALAVVAAQKGTSALPITIGARPRTNRSGQGAFR